MHNSTARKAILVSLVSTMVVSTATAGSVAGNGGSTEVTQILNNVELVQQSAQMYQEVQQTLQQVHASDSFAIAATMSAGDTTEADLPGASNKAALAVKAVLNEVQKTSGSGGGSVQTSHGNE